MSLGFLTESALVPSKAKEIKVDTKSLVDLKALVYQKEEERKRRVQDSFATDGEIPARPNAFRLGKYAHLRGTSKRRKQGEEDRRGKNRRNSGVDARSRQDEEAKARETPDEDDDAAWSKKSTEMLRKKAALYEKMVTGTTQDDNFMGDCLVDFQAKKRMGETEGKDKKPTTLEITDEFGRTRQVPLETNEYIMQEQQWNTAFDGAPQRREGDKRNDATSGGSFVVSQWEKRLKSTEKLHLKEVHEQAALAQALGNASTRTTDKKTRKQLRLERIRKQQEEEAEKKLCHGAPPKDVVDTAASKKATDFLSSLM